MNKYETSRKLARKAYKARKAEEGLKHIRIDNIRTEIIELFKKEAEVKKITHPELFEKIFIEHLEKDIRI